MPETISGRDTTGLDVSWHDYEGKLATVHAATGSYAASFATRELRDAERVVAALEELLKPKTAVGHVDIYLVDPLPATPLDTEVTGHEDGPAGTPDGIGRNGIVRSLQPGGGVEPIARSVTHFLFLQWFGPNATASRPFVEGIAGLIAARTGTGPDIELADQWVRERLAAGGAVSVVALSGGGRREPPDPSDAGATPGPARTRPDLAYTSFIAYLADVFGSESFGKFLTAYEPERRDEAAFAVFQQPLAALDEAWQTRMRRVQRGETIRGLVRYFLPLLKPYRWRYAELISYQLYGALVALALPFTGGCAINALTARPSGAAGGRAGRACALPFFPSSLTVGSLAAVVFAIAVVYAIDAALGIRRAQVENKIFRGIGVALQKQMFARLQRLPHSFHANARVGELTARLNGDAKMLDASMSQLFATGVATFLTLIVATVAVFGTNYIVGIVVLLIIPLFVISRRAFTARMTRAVQEVQQLSAEASAITQENLSAHSVIKAFGLEERASATFAARLGASLKANLKMALSFQLLDTGFALATTFAQLAVIGVGGYMVLKGHILAGSLFTLIGLVQRMVGPLAVMSMVEKALQQGGVAVQRVNHILQEPIVIEDRDDATALPALSREIRFEGVGFSYDADRAILTDVDLVIRAGTNVAIVGPSGSGKSTVVNLLMRFWDPNQGKVLFDGHDLREITIASLRSQIGLVFQDTFVFNTTLRENIAIGRLDASDTEIEAAARAAQLEDYVQSLPAGYDTVLGERGVRMSGGQRQRLAIARALLRDPPVLILDEATSALDARTEAEILETLEHVARSRTTVTITHRLSMAATADAVFVFDQGRIVEQGSHAQLVRAGGLYQRLYEEQTSYVLPGGEPRLGLAARLRSMPLFAGLDAGALAGLAERLQLERFDGGDDLVRQGEAGDKLYIIVTGAADVFVRDGSGERRVNGIKERDYFGELALLTGHPRSATVRASEPVEAYTLSHTEFLRLVEREPTVRLQLSELLGQRRAAYDAAALAAGITAAGDRRSRSAPATVSDGAV